MTELTEMISAGVIALITGTTLVQIAPVKFNPWSWIARKIGREINAEVIEKVDVVEKDIRSLKHDTEEHAAKACRIRILRFGDELRHGVKHSKDHFDQILLDITEYNGYCDKHPEFKNDITASTTGYILSVYDVCLRENSFL